MEEESNTIQQAPQNQNENEEYTMIKFDSMKYVRTKIEALCYLIWRDCTYRFNLKIEVKEIDPDLYIINIGDIINLKIIQMRQFIKIFCGKTPIKQNIDILLKLETYFDLKRSNKIILEENKIIQAFLNKQIYNRILTIFDNRIYLTLSQDNINYSILQYQQSFLICLNTTPILLRICKFLNKKDLLKFLTLTVQSNKNYANNKEFWFHLHSSKYGKTGFKLNSLDWKKVYLNKIK